MMSNNKILTVSYGTFSCTLEGFDDSFGTMKAIAEYFRDLAADDRYFGAEPPQPDAEMLARIAEREISRRVQAREDEGRIVLSADNAAPAMATSAAALMAAPAAAQDAPAAEDVPADDVIEDVSDAAVDDAVEAAAPAAELETPVVEEEAAAEVTPEVAEPLEAEAPLEDVLPVEEAAEKDAAQIEAPILEDDAAEDAAEAFFADTPHSDAAEEEDEEADAVAEREPVTEDAPAPNSIAAKLQRIREVVSQSQEDEEEAPLFEDEHAEEFAPQAEISDVADAQDADTDDAPEAILRDAARDVDDLQQAEDAATAAPEADAADEDEDDIAAILARFDTADSDTKAAESDVITADAPVEAKDDDASGLDTLAALMAADDDSKQDDEAAENLFDDTVAEDVTDPTPETAPEAPAPRRARVIKVKRADIDAAIASGQLEEVEDGASADASDEAEAEDVFTGETSLSAEDEAELLAELAQVEAEMPQPVQDADAAAQADAAPEIKADAPAVNDDDVSRLMAEADNQMDEPEGSGRRNAFAHLKAAVMAKKADKDIGADDGEDDVAFRSDLAEVVKPRRPAAKGGATRRPDAARTAPLKLVAEQRVDLDDTPKGPVRPRRVAAQDEAAAAPEDAGSFADYASDLGAHNLPDLLEAAASYLSFVEGRDQFSRPQLMTKVRQVEQSDFSREDGLRSFGQLLRAGKIEKIKGGRFAVTGDIGYRPDQRAAG